MNAAQKQKAAERLLQLRSMYAAAAAAWGGEDAGEPYQQLEEMFLEQLE